MEFQNSKSLLSKGCFLQHTHCEQESYSQSVTPLVDKDFVYMYKILLETILR